MANYDYERIKAGFEIFDKYEGYQEVAAEHDRIFAGPDPEIVSDEDKETLEEIGWHVDEYDSFALYV